MVHPLVAQLHFTRSEFIRVFEGVSEEDAVKRILPMNCLSWIVGHLATQEQGYWLLVAQGPDAVIHPELNNLVGYGKPASTPPLVDMWASWNDITQAADRYLDSITTDILETHFEWRGRPQPENVGTLLLRNIYHYWFHIGEAHAIRQQLGHENLPEFVGDLSQVPYRPE